MKIKRSYELIGIIVEISFPLFLMGLLFLIAWGVFLIAR